MKALYQLHMKLSSRCQIKIDRHVKYKKETFYRVALYIKWNKIISRQAFLPRGRSWGDRKERSMILACWGWQAQLCCLRLSSPPWRTPGLAGWWTGVWRWLESFHRGWHVEIMTKKREVPFSSFFWSKIEKLETAWEQRCQMFCWWPLLSSSISSSLISLVLGGSSNVNKSKL